MLEIDDHQLLARYAKDNSEAAFTTLVTRYLNLVYSVAIRHTGNAHGAEEISQAVFIILARKAGWLPRRVVLSGWLYQTTRLTAANYLRTEIRRQQREQKAYMQSLLNETTPETDVAWQRIAPLLDDALARLGPIDRDAIVLRYFENKSAREIANVLRVEEATAHKRVERAVVKLRKIFAERGVTLSAATIAAAVSVNSVHAVPVTLVEAISAVASAKGATAITSTLTLVNTTMKTMTRMKLKSAIGIGLAILLLGGTTTTLVARHYSSSNAGIPYKMVDDACQFADGFDQTKLIVRMIIVSRNKPADPSDIHLTIQSKREGPIPVKIGRMGQIINFPHDAMLRSENPKVVAGQPKGTYSLAVWSYLPMPNALTFPYSQLGDAVAEANKGIARANEMIQTGYAGEVPPIKDEVQGVIFVFGKSGATKAKLEVDSKSAKKEYSADGHGIIRLKLDKTLLAQNPQVVLSQKAQYVVVDHIPGRP